MTTDTRTYGDRCRAIRHALGLTQEQLAQRIGCSAGSVRKWESALGQDQIPMAPYRAAIDALERLAEKEATK